MIQENTQNQSSRPSPLGLLVKHNDSRKTPQHQSPQPSYWSLSQTQSLKGVIKIKLSNHSNGLSFKPNDLREYTGSISSNHKQGSLDQAQ